MIKPLNYFVQSWVELRRVHWPSKERAIRDTIYVVIALLVATALIGVVDYGFGNLIELILTK